MHLKRFQINGIKCFEELDLVFPHENNDYSGWVVLLGGNGVGKSTLLQAMALTLVGPVAGQRLFRPEGWVREKAKKGEIHAEIVRADADSQVGQPRKKPYDARFAVVGNQEVEIDGQEYDQPQLVHRADEKERKALISGPYAAKRPGWFSCGYGPFRRLSGGDSQMNVVYSQGREARFATLFFESAALTHCEEWLMQLYSRSIDPLNQDQARAKEDYETIVKVINGLLPGNVRLDRVDTRHAYFKTLGNVAVSIPDLSDGYRSFLALAIDMLKHIHECGLELKGYVDDGGAIVSIRVEGVVLVDEIDSHLHPIWQRDIGFRLRRVFPKIQFIVTSHSPFVAQAATDQGLFVLRPNASNGLMEVSQPVPSVRGWRVDQILTSDLFGLTETRDTETESLLKRHQKLVAQRTWQELTRPEQKELANLEKELGQRLTAPGESVQEREMQIEMAKYVDKTLDKLGANR